MSLFLGWLLLSLMLGALWAWIGCRIKGNRAAEFFCGLAFFSCAALILSL